MAFLEYVRAGDSIALTHVAVPATLEGRGVASRIVRVALDYARTERLKVIPRCSFVASYIRKHPEYQDLVLEGHR